MGTSYSEGGVSVELTGDLERMALEAVDRIIPGVRAAMEAGAQDILRTAQGEWPELTGRSRAGLKMATIIKDDAVEVKLQNAVPYAIYVRPKEWFGSTTAWQRLVRGPMRLLAKDVARELGPVIVAGLKRNG